MSTQSIALLTSILLLGAGCGSNDDDDDGEGVTVSGTVRDFRSHEPIEGSVSVTSQGLSPVPTATVTGSSYRLERVTTDSIFYVLAAAPPTHRATYGAAVEVGAEGRSNVDLDVVAEDYLAELSAAFAVTPSAATGVLFVQAVDDAGDGLAGVAESAFVPPDGALGPYFLDAELAADPLAAETSSSGWVVFFEVDPGLVGLTAEPASGVTMDMSPSPVAPAVATIAIARVVDGAVELPSNVSFTSDVRPIFEQRGCENCHSGSGPGRDLGQLTLDGSANLIHRELVDEAAFTNVTAQRVDLESPENSLVLTMPSAEDPADPHPNITFSGPLDPDYLTILVWIREGALQN